MKLFFCASDFVRMQKRIIFLRRIKTNKKWSKQCYLVYLVKTKKQQS